MDYATPVSGQLVFRRAIGERRNRDYSRPEAPDPWTYSLGVGVLHAPPGAVIEEKVLPVILGGPGRAEATRTLAFSGKPSPLDGYGIGSSYCSDINHLLNTMEVPSPGFPAAMLAHGGLYLRRSRFPGPEGTLTHIVAAVMRTAPEQLPEREMFRIEGTLGGMRLVDPRPMPGAYPIGSTPATTLQMPIWEARDGLRGFYSSLRLDLIDACKELRALEALPERDAEQERRLAVLARDEAGNILGMRRRDTEYGRFVALAREMGEPIELPFDSYLTEGEIATQKAGTRRVVEAMLARNEAPRAPAYGGG